MNIEDSEISTQSEENLSMLKVQVGCGVLKLSLSLKISLSLAYVFKTPVF